jgi:hypothetical protein
MASQFSFRKLILGALAGLVSSLVCLLLAYLVGVVATAWNSQEAFATLLTAVTVLPLMLLLVLLPITIIIAVGLGLFLGLVSQTTNRFLLIIGGVAGAVVSLIVLSLILPSIAPGDFTTILRSYPISLTYGFVVGLVTAWFFGRMTST